MKAEAPSRQVRLAELAAALSLAVDLGFGQPMEHVLRQCLIALRLSDRLGVDAETRAATYYTALMIDAGCHTDAHELSKWFGDDIGMKELKYKYPLRGIRGNVAAMRRLGDGSPLLRRFRIGLEFAVYGHRDMENMVEHHAALTGALAEQLGLPEPILDALSCAYEQWDGRGWPGKRRADQIPLATRLSSFAEFMEVAHRVGGVDDAVGLARARRGGQFDPMIVDLFCAHAGELLSDLEHVQTWQAVIDAEPSLGTTLAGQSLDDALLAVADFVDLKSTYFLGHSRALGELAAHAAPALGVAGDEAAALRRAAYAHGLGRLGISNAIWDKPGPLGAGEWERVRMHPYLTDRMLRQSPGLAPLGSIIAQHRERLDGSGYPHGLVRGSISQAAQILGVADAYQAMREPRPHRAALPAADAASSLRAEARAGRMDGYVVEAVLGAAGHRAQRRSEGPAGLTQREIEVLCLVARGMSNKQIGERLYISPKTVSNHVEHIYTKIDATNRASASLFAMRHGLFAQAGNGDEASA